MVRWASDAHRNREQDRTDRVIRIASEAHSVLANDLPTSCPSFEAVMHFIEWTILNNAHGRLMDIDAHLHERVMEEFLVRLAKGPPSLVARRV